MESLIPILNKLKDVFGTNGDEAIQLPQIIVTGDKSSGKSSIIQSILGRDFLPRRLVTQRPLILQLYNVDDNTEREPDTEFLDEWGKFAHTGNNIYSDFDEIRKEIVAEAKRNVGNKERIYSEPIYLEIYSNRVIDLTLVELPGITSVPIGDQPKDIGKQVKDLVLSYITKPNSILLTVISADIPIAVSKAIGMVYKVDKKFERTLAVITKLDMMDAGTDAVDVLSGELVSFKLGIIGCVNRSQQDINNKQSIESALEDEAVFLQKKYPQLAKQSGIPYLVKSISQILVKHIRDRVNVLIPQTQTLLDSYGCKVGDKSLDLFSLISKFIRVYCSSIKGTSEDIERGELGGGARIHTVFQAFSDTLDSIDPLGELTDDIILTTLQKTAGLYLPLIPDLAAQKLIKGQLAHLYEPTLSCVKKVHSELLRLIDHCGTGVQRDLRRFPNLKQHIVTVMTRLLDKRLETTLERVTDRLDSEVGYITLGHSRVAKHTAKRRRLDPVEETKQLIKAYFAFVIKDTLPDQVFKCIITSLVNSTLTELNKFSTDLFPASGQEEHLLREAEHIVQQRERLVALKKAKEILEESAMAV